MKDTQKSDSIEPVTSVGAEPETEQLSETEPLLGNQETNLELVRKMTFEELLFVCLWPFTLQKAHRIKPWSPNWIKQVFLYAYMVLSCVNTFARCTMLVLKMIEPKPNPRRHYFFSVIVFNSAPVDHTPIPLLVVEEIPGLLCVFLWYVPGMIVLMNWIPKYWPKIVSILFLLIHRKAQIAFTDMWYDGYSYGYGRNWRNTNYKGVLGFLYKFQFSFNESLLNWFVIIAVACIALTNISFFNQSIGSLKVFSQPISSLKLLDRPLSSFSLHEVLNAVIMLTVCIPILVYISAHLSFLF